LVSRSFRSRTRTDARGAGVRPGRNARRDDLGATRRSREAVDAANLWSAALGWRSQAHQVQAHLSPSVCANRTSTRGADTAQVIRLSYVITRGCNGSPGSSIAIPGAS